MDIEECGHIYLLDCRAPSADKVALEGLRLVFVNKEPSAEHAGTTVQEVLRALIDRSFHCDQCLPSDYTRRIIYHLRMALVLHEARALERKVEKGELNPELVVTDIYDGHYALSQASEPTPSLPHYSTPNPDLKKPNYRKE